HRDGRAQQRSDERARCDRLPVQQEAPDRGGGRRRHRGRTPPARQQMQLEEVQRERHPQRVRRQDQQRQPRRPECREPQGGGTPGAVHRGGEDTRRVHGRDERGHGHDRVRVRLAAGDGPYGGQRQQSGQQGVQAHAQYAHDGGQGPGVHGHSSVSKAPGDRLNQKVETDTHRSAMPRPVAPTRLGAMFVAWRDLRFAKGRFALMGTVVVLITLLVGLLSGLTAGLARENTSALTGLPADRIAFAAPPGGESVSFANSAVAEDQWRDWAALPGVTAAAPLGIRTLNATAGERTAAVSAFGSEPSAGLAPRPVRSGEVVLSEPAADELGL
ncbi:predicted protein, partial [Streptomyces pristinaespiralis ATCC 25486]